VSRRRIVKPRFWVIFMFTLAIAFCCVYVSQDQYIHRQDERIAQLRQDSARLLEENLKLERKIAFSKTDAYVERVAHNQLGLLYKDEIRFVAAGQAQGG